MTFDADLFPRLHTEEDQIDSARADRLQSIPVFDLTVEEEETGGTVWEDTAGCR